MKHTYKTRSFHALPVLFLAVLAFSAAGAKAQSDEVLTLDIEPQDAGSALVRLARSSGTQIMLTSGAAKVEVEGLQGEYRLEEALAALLTDTGLAYEFTSENVVLVQEVEQAAEPELAGEAPVEDDEEPIELPKQTVTGSRLQGGDPTARVYSFSAEDIAARGVSSLEELLRTLPWSFPTLTTQTNLEPSDDQEFEQNLGALTLGLSAINLRAFGSANTLVLVNGRRVAGYAGNYDSIVNIINVPLSAVERVDIQLDGASAVYGSDAIGGVVNFITRKDYRGLSATFREEFSSTEADRRNISVNGGYAWGSGNLTATLSRDTSKPINHLKLWTSMDFRPLFGPEFDVRRDFLGQPGIVCEYNGSVRFPGCDYGSRAMRRQLPAGHSGVGATPDDFTSALVRTDQFFPQNGADSTNTSLSLYVEQYLTDNLRVYADVLASDHEAYQQFATTFYNFVVPASNAYNPYGRHVVVSYIPWREIQSGLIPHAYTESEDKQRNYNAGVFWEFGGGHQLEVSAGRSESRNWAWQIHPNYSRDYYDPTADKFYEALASSDPEVALNLFGDGTVQGSAFAELFGVSLGPGRGYSDVTRFESLLRGQLFRLWGGPIDYAVGAEIRREVIHDHTENYGEGGLERYAGPEDRVGLERPTRELSAYFAELAFPIVGPDNARPGLRSLVLSVQARRDTYQAKGAAGGGDQARDPTLIDYQYVPGEGWEPVPSRRRFQIGTPNIVETKKSATSPRVGLQYKPVETFTARAAWSRSFKPPSFSEVFSLYDVSDGMAYFADPFHPDGNTGYALYPYFSTYFNLDIKPEFSDNYSIGFDWSPERIPGLRWTVDWSRVDFTDKIQHSGTLLWTAPEIAYKLPEIVQRDANGHIALIYQGNVNLAEKVSEIVDTQLEYAFDTRLGNFTPRLNYTRVLDEFFRITADTDRVDRVGKAGGSNKYRLTGSLSWQKDRIAADLFVYYTPSYENDRTGSCRYAEGSCSPANGWLRPTLQVDSLITVDLTVSYQFDRGLRLTAGGRNIFEADSPTLWGSITALRYDPTRWDARARVLFLELYWEM